MEGEIHKRLLRLLSRKKARKPKNYVLIICPYVRSDWHGAEQELKTAKGPRVLVPKPRNCTSLWALLPGGPTAMETHSTAAELFLATAEGEELE